MRLLVDIIGVPMWLMGIFKNLDNGLSIILSLLGAVYAGIRIYWTWVEKAHAARNRELELWHKEQDKIERLEKRNSA